MTLSQRPRTSRALSCLLAALLLTPPALALADPAADLAALIRSSAQSSEPVMAFFAGAQSMPDGSYSREQLGQALALANVPLEGSLSQVLGQTTSLTKSGSQVSLQRSQAFQVALGGKGYARLGARVALTASSGVVGPQSSDSSHLVGADPGAPYLKLSGIEGVELSEDGSSFWGMKTLYAYRAGGQPTITFYAGPPIFGRWTTVPLGGAPSAAAQPAGGLSTTLSSSLGN